MLRVGGEPLLRRVVTALRGAERIVVVGPRRDGFGDVLWTREHPAGGGPVAALAAGLAELPDAPGATVAVFAGDLAGVTDSTVDALAGALGAADGALLVDPDGRRQWLIGVWRIDALRGALPQDPGGAALRVTLGGLDIVEVAAAPGEAADVNTPGDLDRARGD